MSDYAARYRAARGYAGSSDAPLLRKLDTNTYRMHSDLSKLCRALADRTYDCP